MFGRSASRRIAAVASLAAACAVGIVVGAAGPASAGGDQEARPPARTSQVATAALTVTRGKKLAISAGAELMSLNGEWDARARIPEMIKSGRYRLKVVIKQPGKPRQVHRFRARVVRLR